VATPAPPKRVATRVVIPALDVDLPHVDHVAGVLNRDDATKSAAPLISRAIAIENQRASAIFEDHELRSRSASLRLLNLALLRVAGAVQPVSEQLEYFRRADASYFARWIGLE